MTTKNPNFRAAKKTRSADGGGLRYNGDKILIELLPPEWIWGLADVMTEGAKKYAVRNWERGMAWSIMIGCSSRHVLKFLCGQRYDDETGCHHLAMAAWNLLALMTYDLREIGDNDLPTVDYSLLERLNSGKGTNRETTSTDNRKRRRRAG